jgi:hypothetical protein
MYEFHEMTGRLLLSDGYVSDACVSRRRLSWLALVDLVVGEDLEMRHHTGSGVPGSMKAEEKTGRSAPNLQENDMFSSGGFG